MNFIADTNVLFDQAKVLAGKVAVAFFYIFSIVAIVGGLFGIFFFIYKRMQYNIKCVIIEKNQNEYVRKYDMGRLYYSNKDKATIFKLRKRKKALLPVPTSDLFQRDINNKRLIYLMETSENQLHFCKIKYTFKDVEGNVSDTFNIQVVDTNIFKTYDLNQQITIQKNKKQQGINAILPYMAFGLLFVIFIVLIIYVTGMIKSVSADMLGVANTIVQLKQSCSVPSA